MFFIELMLYGWCYFSGFYNFLILCNVNVFVVFVFVWCKYIYMDNIVDSIIYLNYYELVKLK